MQVSQVTFYEINLIEPPLRAIVNRQRPESLFEALTSGLLFQAGFV